MPSVGSGGGDTFIVNSPESIRKPLNLLMAIEEIQHQAQAEKNLSVPLDKNFLSTKQKIDFFAVGARLGFLNGLITAALTPFSLGVIENTIKIFGDPHPTLFDQVYAFMLSIGFPLGMAIFLASLRDCYVGTIAKTMIKNLFAGLFTGVIAKLIIVVFAFNWLFVHITPYEVANVLGYINHIFPKLNLSSVYFWVLRFRNVFPLSIVVISLTTLISIIIPLGVLVFHTWRNRKIKEVIPDA